MHFELVMDWVPVFGSAMEKWVLKGKFNMAFLHFLSNFGIFDDFSKRSMLKVLQNFEKSSNIYSKMLANNEEKPIFNLP